MYPVQAKLPNGTLAPVISITKSCYNLNEMFLQKLGFEKNEVLSGVDEIVYRYYNPASWSANGLELHYLKEYNIISIEEFWLNEQQDGQYISKNIVGEFVISEDADLDFIFTKNVRLNFIFKVANRRI